MDKAVNEQAEVLNQIVRETEGREKVLKWVIHYIVEENFSRGHLDAIASIVGLFNCCEEAEREIFEFANRIHESYAG